MVSGYSTDTFRPELAIVANAKLPMAWRYSPRIGTCMPVYIENDTPPLSYSVDISDMFLVSFVSMMEHDCQFRDRRIPWRSSSGCPIEFPFSGQHALQRMPSFTYLAVISPSHLPATDAAASSRALGTDRLFLPFGSLRWYSYSNHEIFNDLTFLQVVVFGSVISFVVSNSSRSVRRVISGSRCLLRSWQITSIIVNSFPALDIIFH